VNSNSWPNNPLAVAALVALVIADIHDLEDHGGDDALLGDFMRTAWPSPRCQRQ
jgi:hypothetical protein